MERLPFSDELNAWFLRRFVHPTQIQQAAWPKVRSGRHCLISAGTGQGKSLAALLPLLDQRLTDPSAGRILYIAPLKSLAKNMAENLQASLGELRTHGTRPLTTALRTGDTSIGERQAQLRSPPDVLLTTPESLFVLLGSRAGRRILSSVEAVVVDEIHALTENKRGAHLTLSLARLDELKAGSAIQRLGLSATVRPLHRTARFLTGPDAPCELVTAGHSTDLIVELNVGPFPLNHVAGQKRWSFIAERIGALMNTSGRGLVFCNTRALVERLTAQLTEQSSAPRVAAHHGSLGHQARADVEARLREGGVDVVVCSSSLELGIDVGNLDWVAQIGSVDSVSAARQRAGRARHQPGALPRLHLLPLTLTDLLNARALLLALARDRIEATRPWRHPPIDVLCQQIIAMASAGSITIPDLHRVVGQSAAFEPLKFEQLRQIISLLHDGYVPSRETGRGHIRLGASGRVYPSPDALCASRLNVGTIPEWFDYEVVDLDTRQIRGRLDEEFAFESAPGQIIQLGGEMFKVERVVAGRVEVRLADDASSADLPFWAGDGCGRSRALSAQVCRLLASVNRQSVSTATCQLDEMLEESRKSLGYLPGADRIVVERFPDPGGDEHLVIHAPFGLRINRAWGLALRKRFCRQFNFELQAVASDNAVLISLGATHSFPLDEVVAYLKADSIESVLIQAVLDTPEFATRFRWCATNALAIERRTQKGRVPPQLQRNQAENLIARIFPDQLACLENLSGPRKVPEHPLVHQALRECIYEFMDLNGLRRIYRRIESGYLKIHCVETAQPSSLAKAVIHAPPSGFLDEAEAEERRTRTFEGDHVRPTAEGRNKTPRKLGDLISAQGLEQALQRFAYLPAAEVERAGGVHAFRKLRLEGGAFALRCPAVKEPLWVHRDHLGAWLSLLPGTRIQPHLPRNLYPETIDPDEALRRIVLGAVRRKGDIHAAQLSAETGQSVAQVQCALSALQAEGIIRYSADGTPGVWTERLIKPVSRKTCPA